MKNTIVITIFFAIHCILNAGNLDFSTKTPFRQLDLKIRYSNELIQSDSVNLICYTFKNNKQLPEVIELSLKKDMFKTYIGEIIIPNDALYMIFKIEEIDDNYSNYWDAVIYDINNKPIENAYLTAGLSYLGNNSESYKINTDFSKAQELIQKELKNFPNNFQAQIALLVLRFDTKKITFQEFEKNLKKLLEKKPNIINESVARTLSRAYKVLNLKEESQKIESEFAKNNPQSDLAEELLLIELASAKTMEQFNDLSIDYIKRFPKSKNIYRITSALINSYLQLNKYEELTQLIGDLKIESPSIYSALALEVRKNKKVFPKMDDSARAFESINIMSKAVELIENKNTYDESLDNDLTKKEIFKQRQIEAATVYETMSELYRSIEKNKAIEYLEKAFILYGESASRNIYIKLIDYYKEQEKYSNCLAITESALISSYTDSLFQSLHKLFYYKLMPTELKSDYEITLSNLIKEGDKVKKRRLLDNEVRINAPKIVLNNINSGFFDTEDLKDSITVVFFWSSWCEPCKTAIPSFEDLENYFYNQGNVRFIAVNVWDKFENKNDDIKKFAVSFGTNMDIYYDINDLAGSKFNLTGLPAQIYIDKKGVIRFFDRGFIDDDAFFEESVSKIEFMLSDE